MTDERYTEVKPEPESEAAILDRQSSAEAAQVQTPDYSYGFNQEPLEQQAVRGSSGGGSYYATATSVSATGDKTITDCPFAPKYARCIATRGYTTPSISIGAGTGSTGSMIEIDPETACLS